MQELDWRASLHFLATKDEIRQGSKRQKNHYTLWTLKADYHHEPSLSHPRRKAINKWNRHWNQHPLQAELSPEINFIQDLWTHRKKSEKFINNKRKVREATKMCFWRRHPPDIYYSFYFSHLLAYSSKCSNLTVTHYLLLILNDQIQLLLNRWLRSIMIM